MVRPSAAQTRNRNEGLRKVCTCSRRTWVKCAHPWHFNFTWAGQVYRFSLDRRIGRIVRGPDGAWKRDRATLGDKIEGKTAAARELERIRAAIVDGSILRQGADKPHRDTLTLGQLFAAYRKQHLAVHRAATIKKTDYMIAAIERVDLERPDGDRRAFGVWLVADVTTDVVEAFRQARLPAGVVSTNRQLELLRSLFNWAASSKRKLVAENPFLDGSRSAVKLAPEFARRRRLQSGEGERLLAAAGPHLRAVIEAAIETGCRRGELLSLQWWQVRSTPKAEIFLPAVKTKTKADRTIPVSTRLSAILEMRLALQAAERADLQENERAVPPDSYVFGNDLGEAVKGFKRAWQRALLVAHGHRPAYVVRTRGEGAEAAREKTAQLTPASLAILRGIDLHFHDLRREAGSRWLEGGVPLHRVQKWLGHANISQTSTYLMAESAEDDEAMKRFEARAASLHPIASEDQTPHSNTAQSDTIENTTTQLYSGKHH